MKRIRWIPAYLLTAGLGLGLAYALSSAFIAPARSQAPPSDGSLPAEFIEQMEQGTPGPPPAAPTPAAPAPSADVPPSAPPSGGAEEAPSSATAGSEDEIGPVSAGVVGDGYVYDPTGRRDPFKPFRSVRVETPAGKNPKKVEDLILEPLQRFELEQLQVLGILWDVRQPRALVRDGDGKVHTLVKNTKLGRHQGYVAAIREGEVVVIETVDGDGGQALKRTRILELRRQD